VAEGSVEDKEIDDGDEDLRQILQVLREQKNLLTDPGWVLSMQNQALRDIADQLTDARKRLGTLETKLGE
jgi:hypothetical protein